MTDLANIKKGEADLSLKFENGKLKVIVSYAGEQTEASLVVAADAGKFIDMLTEAIPGELDNTIGDLLKAAMK